MITVNERTNQIVFGVEGLTPFAACGHKRTVRAYYQCTVINEKGDELSPPPGFYVGGTLPVCLDCGSISYCDGKWVPLAVAATCPRALTSGESREAYRLLGDAYDAIVRLRGKKRDNSEELSLSILDFLEKITLGKDYDLGALDL